jgi:hypothetical protein
MTAQGGDIFILISYGREKSVVSRIGPAAA